MFEEWRPYFLILQNISNDLPKISYALFPFRISRLLDRAVATGVVTPPRKSICRQMIHQTCIWVNSNDQAQWPCPFVGIFKPLHPPCKAAFPTALLLDVLYLLIYVIWRHFLQIICRQRSVIRSAVELSSYTPIPADSHKKWFDKRGIIRRILIIIGNNIIYRISS